MYLKPSKYNQWALKFPVDQLHPDHSKAVFGELDVENFKRVSDSLKNWLHQAMPQVGTSADLMRVRMFKVEESYGKIRHAVELVEKRRRVIDSNELSKIVDDWALEYLKWRFNNALSAKNNRLYNHLAQVVYTTEIKAKYNFHGRLVQALIYYSTKGEMEGNWKSPYSRLVNYLRDVDHIASTYWEIFRETNKNAKRNIRIFRREERREQQSAK